MMTLWVVALGALALDAVFGEPEWLWRRLPHPAALMGRLVAALDRNLNRGGGKRLKGMFAVLVMALVGLGVGAALRALGPAAEMIAGGVLIAQRSLAQHVAAVAAGLHRSLDDGRRAVSMIVGRDPQSLDQAGVSRAAIESCAENFSDGVIAPAFWLLVAGAPGIVIYKIINTADSMIGHRSEKYHEFGWAAARLDDVLNLAPARLSGVLIALAGGGRRALRVMWRDARLHRSPNAGWPESAAAASLGLALAGPRRYAAGMVDDPYLNAEGRRAAGAEDIDRAVALIWRAWGVWAGLLAAALLTL